MQTNMSYTQFEDAAKQAGLLGEFSQWDLNLAKQNPEAGMKILNFKVDAKNATTPEMLALANQGANDERKKYGYTGGTDGGGFYSFSDTPMGGSFTHTSDSVLQAAKDGGVYDQLSPADMQLIQSNPDYGMGVVSGKIQVKNATTDEERDYGRNMAEQSRIQGGGYTTNPDGTGYYKTNNSPNDYIAPEAPKYANNRQGEVDELWEGLKNFEDFSYDVERPVYTGQYDDEMQGLVTDILNRKEFSYDAENDPLYAQYKKQYLREGERASADALGAAAAATGGIPSSYAMAAAAQAGNYYAAQLTDKIPELYNLAYNQYMNENQMKLSALEAVGAMDDRYYGRYLDEINQWNKDRNFEYGLYGDKYNRLADELLTARDMEVTDYGRYLDDVTQYNKDREFGYGQFTDEISHQAGEEEKLYNRDWNERAYADNRIDALLKQENTDWEKKLVLADRAKEEGNVEEYNRIMEELRGSSFVPITEFETAFQSGKDKPLEGVTPIFSFTGDLRVMYPTGYIYGENSDEDYAALVERYGEDQLKAAGITKGEPPYKTYDEAVQYLKNNGKAGEAGSISPRGEWGNHKSEHISYEKYLEAKVNDIMGR